MADSETDTADYSIDSNEVRANKIVARLVSNISHELKTPLNSILAVAGLLKSEVDGSLSGEQHKQVEVIQRNGEVLLELIEDLLLLGTLSRQSDDVRVTPISLRELFENVASRYMPLATAKNVALEFNHNLPKAKFYSDRKLLRTIVDNILGNALKFTPEGGKVQFDSEVSESGDLLLYIHDQGIGMNQEARSRIFDEFYQAENTDSRSFGGVGLGLSLVHSAVKALEGSLEVQSEEGRGTLFRVSLPSLESKWEIRSIFMLIPEAGIRMSLEEGLRKAGYKALFAVDEADAEAIASNNQLAAAIISITGSPDNKLERICQLVTIPRERIVVLVDSGDSIGKELFDKGFLNVVAKPFELDDVLGLVKQILAARS